MLWVDEDDVEDAGDAPQPWPELLSDRSVRVVSNVGEELRRLFGRVLADLADEHRVVVGNRGSSAAQHVEFVALDIDLYEDRLKAKACGDPIHRSQLHRDRFP